MRKIMFACLTLLGVGLATPASAQHLNFAPMIGQILRPMMQQHQRPMMQQRPIQQPVFRAQGSLPDGCDPQDIHNGGNCGNQAAAWCNTWVRMHLQLPTECFQRSLGTQGGGYVQNGGGRGFRGNGVPTQQSTQTTIVTWHRHEEGRQFTGGQQFPGGAMSPAAAPVHVGVTASEEQLLLSAYK